MGQPVKLSENLVLDARLTGDVAERSIASQIEFWAGLGRAVEPLLSADRALALKKNGDAVPLSTCIASVHTRAGRARLAAVLASRPYPHFTPSTKPGLIVKIDADGTRTTGRFVNRVFLPALKSGRTASTPANLPDKIHPREGSTNMPSLEIPEEGINFTIVVAAMEREVIVQSLRKANGNINLAAKLLNLKRASLAANIKRLGLTGEVFKARPA